MPPQAGVRRSVMSDPHAPVRVVLVDDHEMLRRGLAGMLRTADWIEVVGEGSDCVSGLEAAGLERPDVVLLDLRMPGLDGIACLDRLSGFDPPVAVIILTGLDERSVVLEAIRHGAAGYLLKSAPTDEIVATVTRVAEGQLSIDPELLREALAAESRETDRAVPVRHVDLTARELDVLALLAEGMTNKEIGGGLAISEETVKKHVQNIIWKLGAADRTQAAIFALRRGLLAALGTGPTGQPGRP